MSLQEVVYKGVTFRVGDSVYINREKLRYMSDSLASEVFSYGIDQEFIIEKIHSPYTVKLFKISICCGLERLVKGPPAVIKGNIMSNRRKVKDNQYSFTLTHPEALDLGLINKECTRENPLLIIRVGNEYKFLIHKSIYDKAEVCNIPTSLWARLTITEKEIGPIVEWVKGVINAPWPSNKPVKVIVTKVEF